MGSPVAPPIKKQRAGNTPDAQMKVPPILGEVSRRRAELQKLQQSSDQPTEIMDRARSAIRAPPPRGPPREGFLSQHPVSAAHGEGRPPPTTAPPAGPPKGAPVFGMQPPRSVSSFGVSAAVSAPAAPPVPRQVFPSAPGSPSGSRPPISTTQSSSRPNAAITAAAVKSPQAQPKEVVRRLDVSFSSASASRSKSVPPSRPPPPPPPPYMAPEDDIAVGKAPKVVKFMNSPPQPQNFTEGAPKNLPLKGTPHPGAKKQAPPPETTSTPEETYSTKDAVVTPFHPATVFESESEKKQDNHAANGNAAATKTPFRPQGESVPSPLATARRDLLRNMRAFADSPPEKQHQTPPAVMGSPGQDDHPVATEKSVGFLSPLKGNPAGMAPRSKRRVATPHPKRKPSNLSSAEQLALLEEVAGCATFLYEGQGADFIVRRPYGLATEQDFWFRAGQLSAKIYAKRATVDNAATLEVVATIHADGSLLTVHGESQARHQTDAGKSTDFDNVEEQKLGTVQYIDKDANEKEYSLDELYDLAVNVREHYASSVLAGSESLRLRGAPIQPPQQRHTAPTDPEPKSSAINTPETCDKAVLTDKVEDSLKEPTAGKNESHDKQAPPASDDSSLDILGSAIGLFVSTVFSILWFVVIGLPLRIVSSTIVLAASVVLLSFLWLQLADLSTAAEIGATMHMFTNQAGIL